VFRRRNSLGPVFRGSIRTRRERPRASQTNGHHARRKDGNSRGRVSYLGHFPAPAPRARFRSARVNSQTGGPRRPTSAGYVTRLDAGARVAMVGPFFDPTEPCRQGPLRTWFFSHQQHIRSGNLRATVDSEWGAPERTPPNCPLRIGARQLRLWPGGAPLLRPVPDSPVPTTGKRDDLRLHYRKNVTLIIIDWLFFASGNMNPLVGQRPEPTRLWRRQRTAPGGGERLER